MTGLATRVAVMTQAVLPVKTFKPAKPWNPHHLLKTPVAGQQEDQRAPYAEELALRA